MSFGLMKQWMGFLGFVLSDREGVMEFYVLDREEVEKVRESHKKMPVVTQTLFIS